MGFGTVAAAVTAPPPLLSHPLPARAPPPRRGMDACSRGLVAPPPLDLTARHAGLSWPRPARGAIRCCCYARPEPRRLLSSERAEERRADGNKTAAAAAARGRRRGGLINVAPFPFSRDHDIQGLPVDNKRFASSIAD